MISQPCGETAKGMSGENSKGSGLDKLSRTACVGPETIKSEETDFHAFSLSPVEEVYQIVSTSVVKMLNDKSNWSNRLSAVGDIEKTLKQASSVLSDADLKCVVELITVSLNDSQSKVSQKGLQVMEYLAKVVGKRLTPYMTALTLRILIKVSSNKGNLKKAGMSLFKTLMDAVGPTQMVDEIVSCGLRYKTSRVREEAVNVIISALLYYENGGIHLLPIAKELVSCMTDSKAKVRQASFEAIALVSNRLEDTLDFDQVVEMVVSAHKIIQSRKTTQESGLNLMDAYQSRLARGSLPKLDENGLVQYSIPVLRSELMYSGPDVDWICGGVSSSQSQTSSGTGPSPSQSSSVSPPEAAPSPAQESTFRPYRSASKRPWETENKQEVSECEPANGWSQYCSKSR